MNANRSVSTMATAVQAAELRKQRLMREALGEHADPTSPVHASFVFALAITVMVGGMSLTDDSGMGPGYAQIAKWQSGANFSPRGGS